MPSPEDDVPENDEALLSQEAEFHRELASQPHDAYFKRVFSDLTHAREFFQNHLPALVVAALDFGTLRLIPGSFVKRSLHQAHSDLLFTAATTDGEQPVMLYLLFEHQTTVNRIMPLRMLGYLSEIWLNHLESGSLPLPPILPLVLHQGPEPWHVSTNFADLIACPDGLEAELGYFLPKFHHALFDLTQHQPKDEEPEGELRVVLQLMKMARGKQQLLQFFDWLGREVSAISTPLFKLCLLYALHNEEDLDVEEIFRKLTPNPHLKSTAMTTAQALIEKGLTQGLSQGLSQGLTKGAIIGEWIGKIQMLEQFLGLPVAGRGNLSALGVDELELRYLALQSAYDEKFKG